MRNKTDPIIADEVSLNQLSAAQIQHGLLHELGWRTAERSSTDVGIKSVDPRVTHACNHECPHCWANLYGKHMTLDTFDRVLDLAKEAEIHTIQFTGGEPTLNKSLIEMVRKAKHQGLVSVLRTNGRNLHHSYDRANGISWANAIASYFDEVIVSIDGTATANFKMRPVKVNRQLLAEVGEVAYNERMRGVAQKQFDETVMGYEALTVATQYEEVTLKITTVIAQPNINDMREFGSYLSEKVRQGSFKIDCWDLTQVFASPESSPEEIASYVVTDDEFFFAVASASLLSRNISKRAKPQTSVRCLIVDESGRTYIGGEGNTELGTLDKTGVSVIKEKIWSYDVRENLFDQRARKYLLYTPANV